MEKIDAVWRVFGAYLLILILMLVCNNSFGQITVAQFNAEWNKSNEGS